MTTRVALRAQAKLNLWLRVLGKEAMGYHALETLFHKIELADDVVVSLAPAGDIVVTCSEDVGPPEENLAYRAAQLYRATTGWPNGLRIDITKRIPARGGLGGGSADAAATLRALNIMAPCPLGVAQLMDVAGGLGADIPFLLSDAPAALAWRRGDRMLELPALPQRYVALAIPEFGISTAEAFRSLDGARPTGAAALQLEDLSSWERIAGLARNDLAESGAATGKPRLAAAAAAMRDAGAVMAQMTGSGSVVFGIFESEPDSRSLEQTTGCRVTLSRTALQAEAPRRLD